MNRAIIAHVVDLQYLPRAVRPVARRALEATPVVVVMGARQTGKSTFVRSEPFLSGYTYLSLDALDIRERAARAPDDLVRSAPRIVLDEVQREPDLLLAVKRAVDEDRPRVPGRFVLTGSANLLLMSRVSETLAGRASYLTLWPLTRRERLGLGTTGMWTTLLETETRDWYDLVRGQTIVPADWRHEAPIGGYPVPAIELANDDLRSIWFDGYVRTFLERDLRDLAAIDNVLDFRRLMKASALRLGNLINQAELGRDVGLPRSTTQRYLGLLEASFQVERLQSYSINRTRRLVKSPKLYWSDTGLSMHLSGESEPRGAHLENLVLGDLLAWRDAQAPRPEVLYWRTTTDLEVDFVIEHAGRLVPIEVKATRRPTSGDVASLAAFRRDYARQCPGGLLLYDGDDVQWIGDGILAAPWHRIV